MIYPALKELERGGYVTCEMDGSAGRVRKVCRLTEKGGAAYSAAARSWLKYLPHLLASVERAPGAPGGSAGLRVCC